MRYNPSKPMTIYNNVWSWNVADSPSFKGEKTLACPYCNSTNWTLSVQPAGLGTGPNGQWRMGDPGQSFIKCNDCGHKTIQEGK